MKDLSESFYSKDDLLKDESSKDAFSQETLPNDLSPDELFPDETSLDNPFECEDDVTGNSQPDDLSFEDSIATETRPQDLSPENSSTGEDRSTKEPSTEDKLFKGTSSQEEDTETETENDSELPDIGYDIKKSLRAAMQWCDEVANRPDDIVTNFKSQLPFLIALAVIILFLWGLRLIYG